MLSPVFVGDDAPLHLLVVFADTDGEPRTQLAIVERVHHAKNLALVETQPIRRFFLIFKVCPDVERVSHIRLYNPPIH